MHDVLATTIPGQIIVGSECLQCGDCGACSECASYCVVKKLGRQFIKCIDIVYLSSAPVINPMILQHF